MIYVPILYTLSQSLLQILLPLEAQAILGAQLVTVLQLVHSVLSPLEGLLFQGFHHLHSCLVVTLSRVNLELLLKVNTLENMLGSYHPTAQRSQSS